MRDLLMPGIVSSTHRYGLRGDIYPIADTHLTIAVWKDDGTAQVRQLRADHFDDKPVAKFNEIVDEMKVKLGVTS